MHSVRPGVRKPQVKRELQLTSSRSDLRDGHAEELGWEAGGEGVVVWGGRWPMCSSRKGGSQSTPWSEHLGSTNSCKSEYFRQEGTRERETQKVSITNIDTRSTVRDEGGGFPLSVSTTLLARILPPLYRSRAEKLVCTLSTDM